MLCTKYAPLGCTSTVTCALIFYPHAKITHDVLNICDGHTDCHLWGCLTLISITPNSIFVFQQVFFFALLKQLFQYFIEAFFSEKFPALFSVLLQQLFRQAFFLLCCSNFFIISLQHFNATIILPSQGD